MSLNYIRLIRIRRHGLSTVALKTIFTSNFLQACRNTHRSFQKQRQDIFAPSCPAPEVGQIYLPISLKCSLIAAYQAKITKNVSVTQFIVEFTSMTNNGRSKDVVVYEAVNDNMKNWKIVKFM